MRLRDLKEKVLFTKTNEVIQTSVVLSDTLSPKEQEIIKLFKTNLTHAEIAQKLGIGKTTLDSTIKRLGLKRSRQYKYKGHDKKKILELKKLGLSEVAIAKKLGISQTTYRRIKQTLGICTINKKAQQISLKVLKIREYNKKHNLIPDCPHETNVLEKHYDDVVKLLKNGTSKVDIAKRYNVSPNTVFNFIYLYKIKAPQIKKTNNEELIIKFFQQGCTQREIAKQLNCSAQLLNIKIRQLGLNRDNRIVKKASKLNLQEDLIKKLYGQGLSADEIAKQVHAHPVSVCNKIRKMGLTRVQKWADYRSKQSQHDNEIVKLRSSGKTYKEIGKLLNIPDTTVLYRFKRWESANA